MVLNVVVGKLLLREQICWLFNTNKWSQLNDDHTRGWTLQIHVGIPFLFQYLLPFISSCVLLPGLCLPCPWRDDDFVVPPCGVPQICCGSLASGSEMKRTAGGWANFLIVFLNDPQFFTFLSIPKTTHHFEEQEALEEGKRHSFFTLGHIFCLAVKYLHKPYLISSHSASFLFVPGTLQFCSFSSLRSCSLDRNKL